MFRIDVSDSAACCLALEKLVSKCETELSYTARSRKLAEEYDKEIEQLTGNLYMWDKLLAKHQKIADDLQDFQAEKQNKTITSLHQALFHATSIVRESGKIIPQIVGGEFWLEDQKGLRICRKEGDGVKALASLFVRKTVLSNADYLPLAILDESISTVNDTNSAEFSKYLPVLSQDMLIILIEQKPSVFENAGEMTSYRVAKEDDVSVVYLEDLGRLKKEGV